MKRPIKRLIKLMPLYSALKNWSRTKKRREDDQRQIARWERDGRTAPPPHAVKQKVLRDFAKKHNLTVFVETGTYFGDMVDAMHPYFDQIYSIELSRELYENAKRRFYGLSGIELICGDSGVELSKVMGKLRQPALFWLDGHYSSGVTAKGEKDTPIYEELMHIFGSNQNGHVIIIDDARCFGAESGYPNIKELSDFVINNWPNAEIDVQNDSIRIFSSN